MDGQLLARARARKEEIRLRRMAEEDRRRDLAYGRIPELRRIDSRMRELVGEIVAFVGGEGRPVEEIRAESLELQARRAELLTAQGWSAEWLDNVWECPKCRDTGYVEGHMCSCLKELYEQERKKDLSSLLKLGNESFDTFDLAWYDNKADENGISPRRQMNMVFGFCRDYANHFGPLSVNLLFHGDTGLGKTFLSACIARVVSRKGFSVVYETAVSALAAFESQKFRGGGDDADARVERILSCDLLILDDLGTEMITEFSKSALYTIVNSRLIAGKKTIVSTNLDPDSLERVYTPQLASRLQGEYQDLHFVGRDIRLQRKNRS